MPPRWALGYHQARWSYASDTEARAMADGLRAHAIPADAIAPTPNLHQNPGS